MVHFQYLEAYSSEYMARGYMVCSWQESSRQCLSTLFIYIDIMCCPAPVSNGSRYCVLTGRTCLDIHVSVQFDSVKKCYICNTCENSGSISLKYLLY